MMRKYQVTNRYYQGVYFTESLNRGESHDVKQAAKWLLNLHDDINGIDYVIVEPLDADDNLVGNRYRFNVEPIISWWFDKATVE